MTITGRATHADLMTVTSSITQFYYYQSMVCVSEDRHRAVMGPLAVWALVSYVKVAARLASRARADADDKSVFARTKRSVPHRRGHCMIKNEF